ERAGLRIEACRRPLRAEIETARHGRRLADASVEACGADLDAAVMRRDEAAGVERAGRDLAELRAVDAQAQAETAELDDCAVGRRLERLEPDPRARLDVEPAVRHDVVHAHRE